MCQYSYHIAFLICIGLPFCDNMEIRMASGKPKDYTQPFFKNKLLNVYEFMSFITRTIGYARITLV